jgi:hypothetical protein
MQVQKRYLLALVGAALAVVLVIVLRGRGAPADLAPRATGSAHADPGSAAAGEGPRAGSPTPGATGRVRRLIAEERRQLGAQIAAHRQAAREAAARTAVSRGEPAPPGDAVVPLEQAGKPLHDALQESISLLAECYRQLPGGGSLRNATALLTMTSDPELGTVIDTGTIRGPDGRPLDAKLDGCMRDTIDSLALPPLGAGGKLELQYTFNFD